LRYDLNTSAGRKQLGLEEGDIPDSLQFLPCSRLDGEDASCLNLNRVSQPMLLGVNPEKLDQLKAFRFVNMVPEINPDSPWLALGTETASHVISGFADQSVITWGLGKSLGDTLWFKDESGSRLGIRIAGGLENSVFQGNLLISDSLFRKYFPSAGRSRIMLMNGPVSKKSEIIASLETTFRDYGMMVTGTDERLAAFNAVENTYLSVFMLLGGLGVIIGTLGLGIVLLRNIQERRYQFAVMLSVGYRKIFLMKLLLAEYLFILFTGLMLGCLSAFVGILPSMLSPAFEMPVTTLTLILVLIILNGVCWIWFPLKTALKRNPIQSLRTE
jgi:ABC-type antimicrobial peptide transport system permease subunit